MDKIHLYDKILFPVVTEKSTNLSELNKITFKVPDGANKKNLKKNIEKIFKVNVTKINIINKQNRTKLTSEFSSILFIDNVNFSDINLKNFFNIFF